MTTDIFLMLLMATSVLTGLFTEATKSVLDALGVKFPSSNILAGIVAVVLSALVSVAFSVLCDIPATEKVTVCYVALALLSWLSAMVGYDKVVQALTQIGKA